MDDNIKMNLQEVGLGVWTGSSWLNIGQVACTCECVNEPVQAGFALAMHGLSPLVMGGRLVHTPDDCW